MSTFRRRCRHLSSCTGLFLAMPTRRSHLCSLVQIGAVIFLIFYLITRFIPAQTSNLNDDRTVTATTVHSSTKSQYYTDDEIINSRASNRVLNSHKLVHDRVNTKDIYVSQLNDSYVSKNDNTDTISSNTNHLQLPTHASVVPVFHNCDDPLCTEYLTQQDKSRFDSCLQKLKSYKGEPHDGQCHFMSPTHRAPVALASYPGSGNTWLRGLLETATGICTGFEFCDISMRVKGFAGENIVSGAVSVVKTHGYPHWGNKKKKHGGNGVKYDSAVVLVRNPLDAFIAEWNRRVSNNFHGSTVSLTSHVKSAGKEMFGNNAKWVEFLREEIPRWQSMMKEWITSHGRHAILVVKYEDLKKDAISQVKRILDFLQIPYKKGDIETRLAEGFDSFHRAHKPEFEHYTPAQRERIFRAIQDTIELLSNTRLSHVLDIHDYLQQEEDT